MGLKRYGAIPFKHKREIVLLQGRGCAYKKCSFCDYYLDVGEDSDMLNQQVLQSVSGQYGVLEVINSGSFNELSPITLEEIKKLVVRLEIHTLIFECHYLYAYHIPRLKEFFSGVETRIKLGLESFDFDLREGRLKKGIKERDPQKIAKNFDEANLLVGVDGQSIDGIREDIELGLKYFKRICVNVMCDNSKMKANLEVINEFKSILLPLYWENDRIDILLENTDFGVG